METPNPFEPGAARSSQAAPDCVATPQEIEGPYFIDEMLYRSDIRSDPTDPTDGTVRDGVALRLGFRVSQIGPASNCTPLASATVDVWQCDALGVYSDVRDADQGFDTVGQKFLRGAQVTDENGYAEFLTIYPGWYQGRTVHTHFKVRTDPTSENGYEFTSQLYYDDALPDLVHALPPYAAKGPRDTRNDDDGIFQNGGDQLVLQLTEESEGYAATMDIRLDLSAPSSPSGPVGGPGGVPPPPRRGPQ